MSNPNSPEARRLAKELSDLRKLQKASHIAPRLPYSSVPEGNLVVTDSEGNVIDVVGSKPKDGQVILPGKAPSQPSIPTVTAQLGTAQVSWDGSYTEEYVAPDLRHLEVHASTDEEFEVTSGTLIGTITNVSGGTTTAALEYGTWYFKLVAVSHSEARSVPSETASAEVIPLVEAPDMVEVLSDIDTRFGGVITEAGNLGSRLDQAAQDLASHETRLAEAEADLNTLNTVDLEQLKSNLATARVDLDKAIADVSNALSGLDLTKTDLATLKNVTLPALESTVNATKNRLTTAETEIANSKARLTEAETDLTDAFGQISAVDTKAQTAISNASNAQTKADQAAQDALTATGIANGKGKALIQSTAPAVADRNAVTLWIDTTGGANTPKRWNGTAWVAVTDKAATDAATAAANAQTKAQEALTAAGSAQSTADNALTMAGTKSKVFYSTSAPSGTGTNVNDLWRRIDASKNVIGEWYWTGSAWQSSQITTEAISNLDVGKLTAGSAIIQTAVINKIAAQTATVIELNADRITSGTIAAERLNVTDLAARIATVIQLNADRITSGTIATGRLNATEVAAAIANVIQLNASRITAGTINTARLNTNEIAAKVATVIELNADRITAGVISTDRLNVNEIAARSAAFQTVDVKNLFVTTGTMSEAVINKLWADVVMSRKITTQMLAVGAFDNVIADPNFTNEAEDWLVGSSSIYTFPKTEGRAGGSAFKIAGTTSQVGRYSQRIPTNGGEIFRTTVWVKSDVDVPANRIGIYRNQTTPANQTGHSPINLLKQSNGTSVGNDAFPANTWTQLAVEIPVPDGVTSIAIGFFVQSTFSTGSIWFSEASAVRMSGGELIVDGAVTATKIKANAVETDKLAANAVTADKIDVGAIKAKHVSAGEITVDKLAVGSSDNMVVDPEFNDPVLTDARFAASSGAVVGPPKVSTVDGRKYVVIPASTGQLGFKLIAKDSDRYIPVVPGGVYRIRYQANSTTGTASTRPAVTILRANNSTSFAAVDSGAYTAVTSSWQWIEYTWTAPSNAKAAYFDLQRMGGGTGDLNVMTPSVTRMSSGELIVDGAIDGKTITGALFQTDKQAGVGIKISNEGIESYDYEGSKTMQITPGSGVDYIGFFGKPMFDDHYTNADGWMFSSLGAENYVFFTPRRDGDSFRTGSTVRFTFEAQFFVDPDDTTRTSLPVTANVWAYPENTWGSTAGNKRNTSSTFTIDTTARTFDVTVPISQLPVPFSSWVAGLQPADGTPYNGISIQDRVGIRNIIAYINDEEIPLNPRQQLAGIDQSGEVSGQELNISGISRLEGPVSMNGDPIDGHGSGEYGPTIMGRDLLGATYTDFFNENHGDGKSAWLTPMPHGLLSNSYHNGWNGASGNYWTVGGNPGEVQVLTHLRDTVEIKNGRGYLITYTVPAFKVTDGKTGSPGACVLKYAQGRTLGVDAGTAVPDSRYYLSEGSDFDNPGRTIYAVGGQDLPVGDVTIGVEIYVYDGRRIQSTTTADARYWSLNILDVGSAVKGSTGNSQGITKKRPISTEPAPVDPPPAPKPPVKKTYVKTWNASWWGTWWVGNGNGRNSGLDKDGKVAQGKPPGVGYRQRGAVGFPDMTGTLSGSVISKVEIYVYAAHWYSSAGGTLQIGTHDHASKPSVWSRGTTGVKNQKLAKPEGRWITLPTSTHAGVLSGSIKGIQVYTSSTGTSYYGYLTGSKTKIRVTYLK